MHSNDCFPDEILMNCKVAEWEWIMTILTSNICYMTLL